MFRVRLSRAARASGVVFGGWGAVTVGSGLAAGTGVGLIVGGVLALVYGVVVMDRDEPSTSSEQAPAGEV